MHFLLGIERMIVILTKSGKHASNQPTHFYFVVRGTQFFRCGVMHREDLMHGMIPRVIIVYRV